MLAAEIILAVQIPVLQTQRTLIENQKTEARKQQQLFHRDQKELLQQQQQDIKAWQTATHTALNAFQGDQQALQVLQQNHNATLTQIQNRHRNDLQTLLAQERGLTEALCQGQQMDQQQHNVAIPLQNTLQNFQVYRRNQQIAEQQQRLQQQQQQSNRETLAQTANAAAIAQTMFPPPAPPVAPVLAPPAPVVQRRSACERYLSIASNVVIIAGAIFAFWYNR